MSIKKVEIIIGILMILAGVCMLMYGIYETRILYVLAIIIFLVTGLLNIIKAINNRRNN